MGIRPAKNQSGGDAVLAVQLQETRETEPESVREVAGRWEQGLRGLLGLAGVTGLVGAPLAVERLAGRTQVIVGVLLCTVLVTAGAGLLWTMSAAYGSVRVVQAPGSRAEFQRLRWSLVELDRRRLIRGRRFAIGGLFLFVVAVAVAWLDPAEQDTSKLQVVTDRSVTYCGLLLDAPDSIVAVYTAVEGRVEVEAGDVTSVSIVDHCDDVNP